MLSFWPSRQVPPPRDTTRYETIQEVIVNPEGKEHSLLEKRVKVEVKFYAEPTKYGIIGWRMEEKRAIVSENIKPLPKEANKVSILKKIMNTLKLSK